MVDDELLAAQLRRWADTSAAPVDADEVVRGAPAALDVVDRRHGGRRGRRSVVALAAAAVLVVLIAAFAARPDGGSTDVATDGASPHRYQVDVAASALERVGDSRATYLDMVAPTLVATIRGRLFALGRTDAVVSLDAPGSVVVAVDRPLTDGEQHLVLGAPGWLGLAVVGTPTDPASCDGPLAEGVGTRSGTWPDWGSLEDCFTVGTRTENRISTLEDDALIRLDGAAPAVERQADGTLAVRIDDPQLPTATGSGPNDSLCGDADECLQSVALTIDGVIYDGPGPDRDALPFESSVPVGDDEDGRTLTAILIGGPLPAEVTVTDLGTDAPTTTAGVDDGSAAGTAPVSSPPSGVAALQLEHGIADLDAAELYRPIAGATIELRQDQRVVQAVSAADGTATPTVGIGMWTITASSPTCSIEVTVVVLTPGSPFVALTCQAA